MYERIRNLREDKDMTQVQMAKLLNIHQTTYSDYELGRLNIPIAVLNRLADLFETSIDYPVNRTDERWPCPPRGRRVTPGYLRTRSGTAPCT